MNESQIAIACLGYVIVWFMGFSAGACEKPDKPSFIQCLNGISMMGATVIFFLCVFKVLFINV